MASSSSPKVLAFLATAAIAAYKAVKAGADDKHVAVCSAASDESVGIVQNVATAAEDTLEVALPGGGAKALLGGTVAFGNYLAPDANGDLVVATTGQRYIAIAMQAGVDNDVIGVEVASGIA